MKKIIILLIITILSLTQAYWEEYTEYGDVSSTNSVNGDINQSGNSTIEVKWNSLVDWDINASEWDNVVIDNDRCLLYPDECEIEDQNDTQKVETSNTNNEINLNAASTDFNPKEVTALPTTWPKETLLLFLSLILWLLIFIKSKKTV